MLARPFPSLRRFAALAVVGALASSLCGCIGPMERARRALEEGDDARAIAIVEGVAREHPDEPGAWLSLGRARMETHDTAGAREAYEHAARLLPTRPGPRILIGHTYELDRDYDAARTAYESAVALAPTEARPERVLGVRLLRWGLAEDAVPHLERALALRPDPQTWNALALARLHAGDAEGAEREWRRACRAFPEARSLALGLAAVLIQARRLDDALAVYDGVVAREPAFAPGHIGRALVLHELGRCVEARAALDRAVQVDPSASTTQRRAEYLAGPAEACVTLVR